MARGVDEEEGNEGFLKKTHWWWWSLARGVGEKKCNGRYKKGHFTKLSTKVFFIEVWIFEINQICVFFELENQDVVYMFSFVVVLTPKFLYCTLKLLKQQCRKKNMNRVSASSGGGDEWP